MNYAEIILYCFIVWCVLMTPVHFAGLNKKPKNDMGRVRIACWLFGWTGIGWLWALWLALTPNPPE